MPLDPVKIFHPTASLKCPKCGATVVREGITGRPGVDVRDASCTECDWKQRAEYNSLRSTYTTVKEPGPPRLDDPAKAIKPVRERGRCAVAGCGRVNHESGLCELHWNLWVGDGRPYLFGWVKEYGMPKKKTITPVAASRRPKDRADVGTGSTASPRAGSVKPGRIETHKPEKCVVTIADPNGHILCQITI